MSLEKSCLVHGISKPALESIAKLAVEESDPARGVSFSWR
jgi:hypothetical protein